MELERQQMKNDKGANRKDMILRLGKMQADANKEKSQVETVLQNQVEMLSNEKSQLESELDKLQVSERSEQALRKTSILAMDLAK
tara:strand:- start:238 stop:492 length:255 start_codon:yes stop_codon:yes gene_type:complete